MVENNRDILFFNDETIDSFPVSSKRRNILMFPENLAENLGSPGCGGIARQKNLRRMPFCRLPCVGMKYSQ